MPKAAVEDGASRAVPLDRAGAETSAGPTPAALDKDLPPIPGLLSAGDKLANGAGNGNSSGPGRGAEDAANGHAPISALSAPTLAATITTSDEAEDYINGGEPHKNVSPRMAIEASPNASPGALRPIPETAAPAAPATPAAYAASLRQTVDAADDSAPASPVPARRRSVQFSRSDVIIEPLSPVAHFRQSSWDANSPSKSKAFISRLRALAVQGGLPPPKSFSDMDAAGGVGTGSGIGGGGGSTSTSSSPTHVRGSRLAQSVNGDEGSDVDADAEETADEDAVEAATNRSKKRRRRIHYPLQQSNVPHTPSGSISANTAGGANSGAAEPDSPQVPLGSRFNMLLQRRMTMPEAGDHRGGLSEGEGRDHLSRQVGWRRGSSWMGRSDDMHEDGDQSFSGRFPLGHHRRKTTLGGAAGGGESDGDGGTPRRAFFTGERATTFGAQKWRQVKNTWKLLRQKRDDRFDYLKSAELMAELRAGAPAVLIMASMIQRDEHGNKRIPVLLEQVKLRISDSKPVQDGDSKRHWLFTLDLEYGSGPSRMKWTVQRTIREILELHWKYKLALRNEKYHLHTIQVGGRPKQPRFPVSAFPYVRGLRGVEIDDEDDNASVRGDDHESAAANTDGNATAGEGTATDIESSRAYPSRRKSRAVAMSGVGGVLGMSRRSSVAGGDGGHVSSSSAAVGAGAASSSSAAAAVAAGNGEPGSGTGAAADGGTAATGDLILDEATFRRRYVDSQQRLLEKYLNEMIHWLIFRADSNRLCRFLELSALGVRLAAEGSYHGKECFLHIQSSKGLDFRRVLTPGKVIERHSRKWFLVRQSYIVCVESPEKMNIYDVYLVDPKFLIISKKNKRKQIELSGKHSSSAAADDDDLDMNRKALASKHHTLTIRTSERKVKLWGRNQHIIRQFEESMLDMLKQTPWYQPHRFESFAPVRTGVFAQWLVDGRDYMWNVSRAIAMAKDVIYIHDWWLSPELYMRRPACISQKWRLDRLLQRKASEGVKIFVIIYRNVEAAIPIDSEYTKFSLLNLHPNIFVQRSPNQFKKNQFFFAHHEKICVVDHDVAFIGGIDLCFGRWDSPQHSLVDDKPTGFEVDEQPKDADHCQLWPGKDYSNPRVQDFFSLREPYKEMYDRTKVPRMPWHDVGMQVVGQPARDLTRHFVQRWNYLRRGRKPTRPTPFLLPPPDCRKEDLDSLGLSGTCEVQILRSASAWSLGITGVECSIQTAYISMIEESEHFVYIENQFFISSTETLNVKIVNRIGDALVERILRAHANDEDWRCVLIIPLMPGFQNSVADQEGTSVRLILQCQYRSICRGENSIFGRLRAAGIEPEDYIQFFSLRQWGRINNNTVLTTEQLYIHAKAIIVDDRVALIGSANINERSMLGDRDSEIAAIVRDRDMISSTMAGQPYRVGRFAHTLRLRLMQEHLGLDTDEIMEDNRREAEFQAGMDRMYSDDEGADNTSGEGGETVSDDGDDNSSLHATAPGQYAGSKSNTAAHGNGNGNGTGSGSGIGNVDKNRTSRRSLPRLNSYNHNIDLEDHGSDAGSSVQSLSKEEAEKEAQEAATVAREHTRDVEGLGDDHWTAAKLKGIDRLRDSTVVDGREVLVDSSFDAVAASGTDKPKAKANQDKPPTSSMMPAPATAPPPPASPPKPSRQSNEPGRPPLAKASDEADSGGAAADQPSVSRLTADIRPARITKDCMRDPLDPAFYDDVWNRVAENNTKIFRRVFRCLPDSEVTNWHEFQEFIAYGARFQESMESRKRGTSSGATTAAAAAATDNNNNNGDQQGRASHNVARHAGGGGAGISVPTLGVVEGLAEVGEHIAGALLHHAAHPGGSNNAEGNRSPPASSQGSGGHADACNEKQARPLEHQERGAETTAASKTEMQRAAAAENAFKRRPMSLRGRTDDEAVASLAVGELSEKTGKTEGKNKNSDRRTTFSTGEEPPPPPPPPPPEKDEIYANNAGRGGPTTVPGVPTLPAVPAATPTPAAQGSVKRRKRATTKTSRRGFQGAVDELLSREEADELMKLMQGQLVQFPYNWLLVEEGNGNWLYQVDQVAPLQIYN